MTSHALPRSYSIKEAAALTGLPASTLRYYEQIGVIAPISRGASSGHRVYDEADMDRLMGIACLAATGMSIGDMRTYVANNELGSAAADEQIRLLTEQEQRLALVGHGLPGRVRTGDVRMGRTRERPDPVGPGRYRSRAQLSV